MIQDSEEEDSNIIEFVFSVQPTVPAGIPSRDELAQMVRSVLTPAELFKMNAPKVRKKNSKIEIIEFVLPTREEKNA